jgi:hypothetical protein
MLVYAIAEIFSRNGRFLSKNDIKYKHYNIMNKYGGIFGSNRTFRINIDMVNYVANTQQLVAAAIPFH